MSRIYLASSWRNTDQPRVVQLLRKWGHQVYDFRNPQDRSRGFAWSDMDSDWLNWDRQTFRKNLTTSPIASHGYLADLRAMEWCDICVLLMPCGRSAHLELGWAAGRGKRTVIYLSAGQEPELMYLLADNLVCSDEELRKQVAGL